MKITTEKNRKKRHYFDKISGKIYNSLFEIPGKKEIDENALELFFHIGYVPGNSTIFKNIDCLPGGCDIVIKNNNWEIEHSYDYCDIIDKNKYEKISLKDLEKIGGEIFLNIVEDLYIPNTKVVIPLSGGYDSRVILEVTS